MRVGRVAGTSRIRREPPRARRDDFRPSQVGDDDQYARDLEELASGRRDRRDFRDDDSFAAFADRMAMREHNQRKGRGA